MGQSNGVLFKEVSAFQRCSLIEISLCTYVFTELLLFCIVQYICTYVSPTV